MDRDVRVTALQQELRFSTNPQRRARILVELSRLGVLERAVPPSKETR